MQGLARHRGGQILIVVCDVGDMPERQNVSGASFMLNRNLCDVMLQENLQIKFSLRGLLNSLLGIIKVILG